MKNKTAKKAITAILVCFAVCMSAIAAITFGAQTPVTASAAETSTVSGYNLYDLSTATMPAAADYIETETDDGLFYLQCKKDFDSSMSNRILTHNMYFQAGVTYNVSFKVSSATEMSSSYNITVRYLVDKQIGALNDLTVKGVQNAKTVDGVIYTEYSTSFTPSTSSCEGADYTRNSFDFTFAGFKAGDEITLFDIKVLYPVGAEDGGRNLSKNLKFGGGDAIDAGVFGLSTISEAKKSDDVFGEINTFKAAVSSTDEKPTGGTYGAKFLRTDITWETGAEYRISFWFKSTSVGTVSSYAQIRQSGKYRVMLTNNKNVNETYKFQNDYTVVPFNISKSVNQWRMFNYVYKPTEEFPTADTTQTQAVFEICIEKFGAGTEFSFTNFKVVKLCDHSEGEKEATYTWSKDYSTCTAEYGICKSCDSPTANYVTETVTAVKSETAATFTAAGETVYTATFENSTFTEQTKTIAIAVKQAAVKTYDGVSFRIIAPYGLRWSSGVDKNDYNALVEEFGAENVTVGTLITAYDLLGETDFTIEAMSAANIQYKNIVNDTWHTALTNEKNDGNFCYYASLVNIQDHNLNREFAGRAYVKAEKDGKTYYYYAAFAKENNVRTYTNLCKALVKENKESEAATNFAKGVIDKTVDITLTENTATIVTVDNYVSPYTVAYVDGKLTLTAKDGGNVTNVKFIYVNGEKKAFTQNGNALEVTL